MAFGLSRIFAAFAARRAPRWRAAAGDVVIRVAPDGEILSATRAADAALAPGSSLESRSILDFVAREDRAALKDALARARCAAAGAASERVRARLLRAGRPSAAAELLMARDGGALAVLVRETGRDAVELRPAPAPAQEAAPAAMLADLGHEMKTPLNAIVGFAEAMRAESFGPIGHPKYAEYAEHIHASGLHLAELVGAMLDRGRIDAGRYRLEPVLTDPAAPARAAAAMLRAEAEKAGLSYRLDIAGDLDEAMLDPKAVRQILINLLSNAVKFTAAGEVSLRVAQEDGVLVFTVADTGVGMSQTALARLGERFTGLHKSGVRGAGGAGLGLSLAYSLAKLHGGALTLSSAPGEGSVATLRLPACRTLAELNAAGLMASADIQSQLDRVAQFRRERNGGRSAA